MRARRTLALTAALSLLFTGGALAASATDPVTLGASHVLDEADVLSASEEAAAEARLQQLSDETTVDLWVVYVDEFTNPADAAGLGRPDGDRQRARREPVPARGRRRRAASTSSPPTRPVP